MIDRKLQRIEKKVDLIMRKLDICEYPKPGHICHQCSVNPHEWIDIKEGVDNV